MKKHIYPLSVVLLCTNTVFAGPHFPNNVALNGGSGGIALSKPAPLVFIENKGQVNDQWGHARHDIQFMAHASQGLDIFVGNGAIHYQFKEKSGVQEHTSFKFAHLQPSVASCDAENEPPGYASSRMDVELIGADKYAKVIAEQIQTYYENYFLHGVSGKGVTAHSFAKVTYKDVYPNIDWVLYAEGSKMKQEFVVRKGGIVGDIKLKYNGCTDLALNEAGALVASGPKGTITENTPHSYQQNGKEIDSRFKLEGNLVRFDVASYEGNLVIDPELLWATYFGGSNDDQGACVVADDEGNVYMGGAIGAAGTIATTGAYQASFGGGTYDAFLVKFSSTGTRLWATYYGGTGDEAIFSLTIDRGGNLYATGYTTSLTGMATPGALQTVSGGSYDAFLAKFSIDGALKWATYYGGSNKEFAYGVTTDLLGDVYIGGQSNSTSGISTPGAYQTTIGDGTGAAEDAFVAKFDSTGNRLWATYYGGFDLDFGSGIAVDTAGNVFLSGFTESPANIATPGAPQTAFGGGTYDAFLVMFTKAGARAWGTYLGGTGDDECYSMTSDAAGNVYIGGATNSASGIATSGAYQAAIEGDYDGFVAKFNSSGNRVWSTYYGGYSYDDAYCLATDDSSNVFIVGQTSSLSFITTPDAWKTTYGGGSFDAYMVKFDSLGARKWASYFGGVNTDIGIGITADKSGNIFITGSTTSTSGIATSGAYQMTYGGGSTSGSGDGFLAKFHPESSTGVNSIQVQNPIHLYPNPASEFLRVDVADRGVLTIYSPDGRVTGSYELQSGHTEIKLPPSLAAGSYMCNYHSANGQSQTLTMIIKGNN